MRALRRVSGFLCALVLVAPAARGAEIDSVTGREVPLRDSSRAIERRLTDALETGVARANEIGGVCDEEVLYREVRRALAQPFIGHLLTESLNEDPALDSRRVMREDSIYRDLGLLDNISVHWKDLSAVVNVDDVLIGVDKIGHLAVEGWGYFQRAYVEGNGVDAAMDWGEQSERTYFGSYTTGIYSYADLTANFEGMRFWLHVLGQSDDPLDAGRRAGGPYVTCRRRLWLFGERRWRVARAVDLGRYVTPAWDEAVNCSTYRTDEIAALVGARVREVSEAAGVDYTCPVDPDGCALARERYGDRAPRLLHPDCLDAPSRRRWWQLWK